MPTIDYPAYPIRPVPMPEFTSHCQWSGGGRLLSAPECAALIAIAEQPGRLQQASIGNPDTRRVDPAIRKVDSTSILCHEAEWLYERIAKRVEDANNQYWRFVITGLMEPIQFLRYEAAQAPEQLNGHYGWHQDFGADYMVNRKLSMVVQLSDPAAYKGCRLHLMTHNEWEAPYVGQGDAILFPSWTPHRVLPIEEGRRYALAIWVHGPRFA